MTSGPPPRPRAARPTPRAAARAARARLAALGHGLCLAALAAPGPPARHPRARLALGALTVLGLWPAAMATLAHAYPQLPGALVPFTAAAQVAPALLLAARPLAAWRLAYLLAWCGPLLPGRPWGNWAWDPVQIPLLLAALAAAGLRGPRRLLWGMAAWCLPLIWAWEGDPGNAASATVLLAAFTAGVDALRGWRATRHALATERERGELERARRAALEERARIARELHDVVAHHMSLMAVRAETAPYRLHGLSGPVRAEFAAVAEAARDSLADMRRLLTALRGEEPPERAPQPGLADLPGLAAGARAAGVEVTLTVEPGPEPPPTAALAAHRIVQEALSNARRHAPGAPVEVLVTRPPGLLLVRVANGPATGPAAPAGPGHGLRGMAERAALLGGTCTAGPAPGGGFEVVAELPLGRA